MYADLWGRRKPKAEFQLKDRIACFGFLLWEAAPILPLMLRYEMPYTFTTARLYRLTSHGQLKADLIVVANYTYAPSPIDNLAPIMRMIQGFRKLHRSRSV